MVIPRCYIGLASAIIFQMGIWLPGSVPQAAAENLNLKMFSHVTKMEMASIADAEGHTITLTLRKGVTVFENGEWAWVKATLIRDLVKGTGTADNYTTWTFLDGSTVIVRTKSKIEGTPQGVAKFTGDIIHGTGRFQGVKGTGAWAARLLTPDKGEPEGKTFVEGTLVYTLPNK